MTQGMVLDMLENLGDLDTWYKESEGVTKDCVGW